VTYSSQLAVFCLLALALAGVLSTKWSILGLTRKPLTTLLTIESSLYFNSFLRYYFLSFLALNLSAFVNLSKVSSSILILQDVF
jgi:hypothetical protein